MNDPQDSLMEQLLLEHTRSYSRFYSRSESKTVQRSREQMFQEREMAPLVQRLERLYGPLQGARVLEIGSGSGARSVALALHGAEVVGIDPSEPGVAASRLRAQRYPGLRVDFRVGVGERIPFPDGSFDLAFSIEVLQHVQVLWRVIAETHRVLRPGGHCYHEAPNSLYPREFHYRIFWIPYMPKAAGKLYARLRGKDPRHLDDINFLYRGALTSLMRRHGFVQIRDLYSEELAEKVLRPEKIRSPIKRRLFHVLSRLRLFCPAIAIADTLGTHPQLRIHAVKSV